MDRLALIGDIHGNLPALEAVLAEIDRRGIERIICLGDVAGKGPSGATAVDLIRQRCAVTIQGNWDAGLAQHASHPTVKWCQRELGAERRAWLGGLPFRYDFVLSGQRVRQVHASPQGVEHRVLQSAPPEHLLMMFENTDLTDANFQPDIVGYADTHTPFVRTFLKRPCSMWGVSEIRWMDLWLPGRNWKAILTIRTQLHGECGSRAFPMRLSGQSLMLEKQTSQRRKIGVPSSRLPATDASSDWHEMNHGQGFVRAARSPERWFSPSTRGRVREGEEGSVAMGHEPTRSESKRMLSARTVTERTAGALSKYASKQLLRPGEEREAFERLVAEEVVSSMEDE